MSWPGAIPRAFGPQSWGPSRSSSSGWSGSSAAAELGTPEGRARAADSALAAVAEHPDNLVRDQYLMQVAGRCRLEPSLLRERLEQIRRDGPRPDEPASRKDRSEGSVPGDGTGRRRSSPSGGRTTPGCASPTPTASGTPTASTVAGRGPMARPAAPGRNGRGSAAAHEFRPGLEALRLAIHRPEEVADRLEAVLFRDDLQRAAFEVLAGADPSPSTRSSNRPPPRSGPCWSA